ncbi:hypothetical protein [Streptantibioticus ferralitis]|uniref:SbtR family transcriptional regulator n=1 Tax=Streptantibioticus ferralitis TaxID=236510 RepID=UPI00338C4038
MRRIAEPAGRELLEALGVLLQRGQDADVVRRDAAVPEVHALLVGVSRAAELAGWDKGVRDRSLAIVFDGLRPSGSHDHLN